jgi:KDO2-lipid IV(A) lauroyltransferase
MNTISYYIWYPFIWLISWLPFRVLYALSDFLYWPVSLTGYRKKIILGNLEKAFPDKDECWRKDILHKFYRHFCDLFVETLKLQHMSKKTIKKRITFSNIEAIEDAYDKNLDVVAVMAHYGNWEYMPSINLHFKAQGFSVYRPLKSQGFDKYMLELRSRFGTQNVTMKNTLRKVVELRRSKTRFVLGLIADQSPARLEIQYWTKFLTQTTPILMGPEKIAKLTNGKVVFLKLSKPKRGHYHVDVIEYPGLVSEAEEHEITEWHVRQLENCIRERPELWLWSHKRWKYQDMRDKDKG